MIKAGIGRLAFGTHIGTMSVSRLDVVRDRSGRSSSVPNQPGCPISIKRHISNPRAILRQACPHEVEDVLPAHERRVACETIRRWEGYHPTALRSLPEIASELGIADVLYKDESTRFEPHSFKSLGGAYAVQSLLATEIARDLGRSVTLEDIGLGRLAVGSSLGRFGPWGALGNFG